MTHTDVILIISIFGLSSTVGVWLLIKKINQSLPTPQNVLSRGGDIELVDYIEPTQPLPVFNPIQNGWYSEPINWIESNPLDSITVIEGLNSDPISSIVSPLNSISEGESLDYDSLNLEPIDDLIIHSILENDYNLYYLFYIIIILIIIISIFILYKKTTKFLK